MTYRCLDFMKKIIYWLPYYPIIGFIILLVVLPFQPKWNLCILESSNHFIGSLIVHTVACVSGLIIFLTYIL